MNINASGSGMMMGMRPGGMQAGGMRQGGAPPDAEQAFSRIDTNGDNALDLSELQTLADKISEMSGRSIDAEKLMSSMDTDQDGLVNAEEAKAGLEQFRPDPNQRMGGMSMGGMLEMSFGGDSQGLIEMLNNLGETEAGSSRDLGQLLLAQLQAGDQYGEGSLLDLIA